MASILKGNTIQDATNSNTAMTIDSSGRVATPVKPSFFVTGHQSSSTDFTTGGGSATINGVTPSGMALLFNYRTVHHNIGGHFLNATGRFTCPIDGLYLVTGHVGYKDATNYFGLSLFLTSNATANLADLTSWSQNNNNHAGHTLVGHVNATAGQQFVMTYKTSYANPSNGSGDGPYTSFGATFLG